MNDKYLNHSVEDLIADDVFIEWVLNPNDPNREEWAAWMVKHPQMQHNCQEAKRFIEGISIRKMDTSNSAEKIWSKINADMNPIGTDRTGNIRRLIIKVAAAACISLVIISQFWNSSKVTIESNPGIVTNHALPDGSTTMINDASSISYDKSTFDEERKISLTGEAFFEVEKGARFVVATPQGDVEVLGTSFNVFSHDDRFVVQCLTGSVQVTTASDKLVLSPGNISVRQNDGSLKLQDSTRDRNVDWRSGVYKYENVPLKLVVSELERQFAIEIEINDELKELKYTGFFEDKDMDKALSSVFWPLKLKYAVKQNHVQIQQEE